MRQIVLDTETTGLEAGQGHRIIEIGCVELVNRRLTGRSFHKYLNPERAIDEGAAEVHGMRLEDLADKPRFIDVAPELIEFVKGAELIIHNAPFDLAFLDAELARIPGEPRRMRELCLVLDTLELARRMHPGQRNSLDALCKRYAVDNSSRELHGALLDAKILSDVYLSMTGGQATLTLDSSGAGPGGAAGSARLGTRPVALKVIRASAEELAAHERTLDGIDKSSGGPAVWRRAKV
ncbi:MAG TPA: DNA polymerase III subunit epsilon [Steroidobacteraceae bacterium]|nr:DNA polymerase III subunit epsilon [Steroidobacteraceae bacterium]